MTESTVTLEEALKLLSLPREVGVHPDDGQAIVTNFGRFGPYVKHGDEFRSLESEDDVFTISLDALGSSAFLRAVHAYERPQMTAVYRTYLDLSDLLPPLVYSVVLSFFELGAVFVTLGIFTALCGVVTWIHLPKSM